jgi:hypothetical protein
MGEHRLAPGREAQRENRLYAVLGYPISQSFAHDFPGEQKAFLFDTLAYASASAPFAEYEARARNPKETLLITYDDKHVYDQGWNCAEMGSPIGLSGSPVWDLSSMEESGRKVVGIFIGGSKGGDMFYATDIGKILPIVKDRVEKIFFNMFGVVLT